MSIKISPVDVIKMQDDSLTSIISNAFSFDDETVLFAYGEMISRKIEFSGDDLMKIMDFTIKKGWKDIDNELKNRVLIMGFASYERFKEAKQGRQNPPSNPVQSQVQSAPTYSPPSVHIPEPMAPAALASNVSNQLTSDGNSKMSQLIMEISRSGEDLYKFFMAIVWQVVCSVGYAVILSLVFSTSLGRKNTEILSFLAFAFGIAFLVFFIRMIMFLNKGIKRLKDIDHLNHN